MFILLLGALLGLEIHTTINYKDCEKLKFEPKACDIAKAQHDLNEVAEKL